MKQTFFLFSALLSFSNVFGKMDAAGTRNNFWQGATIGYNLDGASVDNIIGNTKVAINPFSKDKGLLNGAWAVVGNFGNFISSQNKEDVNKDIKKIVQQSQGLNVGLGSVWSWLRDKSNSEESGVFRIEFITGYRLNGFQKVGTDSSDIVLSQFRNSLGFEYETAPFLGGGKLSFAVEGSATFVDKSKYEQVFNEQKSMLFALEASAIIPFSGNMGLLVSSTYVHKSAPVYQIGIVIKPASN